MCQREYHSWQPYYAVTCIICSLLIVVTGKLLTEYLPNSLQMLLTATLIYPSDSYDESLISESQFPGQLDCKEWEFVPNLSPIKCLS